MKHRLTLALLLVCVAAHGQQSDPWPANAIVTPAALASQLKAGSSPHILYVGFPILYKGAHIAHALFAGPGSNKEGLELLAEAVRTIPRDAQIIIYCGCCPFVRCPNIRPAYTFLKDAGYTNVKVLQLDTNLHTDWVEKGYPTEK